MRKRNLAAITASWNRESCWERISRFFRFLALESALVSTRLRLPSAYHVSTNRFRCTGVQPRTGISVKKHVSRNSFVRIDTKLVTDADIAFIREQRPVSFFVSLIRRSMRELSWRNSEMISTFESRDIAP